MPKARRNSRETAEFLGRLGGGSPAQHLLRVLTAPLKAAAVGHAAAFLLAILPVRTCTRKDTAQKDRHMYPAVRRRGPRKLFISMFGLRTCRDAAVPAAAPARGYAVPYSRDARRNKPDGAVPRRDQARYIGMQSAIGSDPRDTDAD